MSPSKPPSLPPGIVLDSYSRHRRVTCDPGRRCSARHSSSIGRITIYWMILFWRRRTCVSLSSRTTYSIDVSKVGYSRHPFLPHFGFIPIKGRTTLWWDLPRLCPILRIIVQVSYQNNRFELMNALYNVPEVRCYASSFPKILDKRAHFLCAF